MRISDWSSDVCSSDLIVEAAGITVVTSRCVDFELVENRRIQFRIGRIDAAIAFHGEAVQTVIALRTAVDVGVDRRRNDRPITDRHTNTALQGTTRKVEQNTADRKSTRLNSSHYSATSMQCYA